MLDVGRIIGPVLGTGLHGDARDWQGVAAAAVDYIDATLPDSDSRSLLENARGHLTPLANLAASNSEPQAIEDDLIASIKRLLEIATDLTRIGSGNLENRSISELHEILLRIKPLLAETMDVLLRCLDNFNNSENFRESSDLLQKIREMFSVLMGNAVENLVGVIENSMMAIELATKDLDRQGGPMLEPETISYLIENATVMPDQEPDLTSSGFASVLPRFYSLMCLKVCIKAVEQCLQKSNQLIQHWEQVFFETYEKRVEIDGKLKRLCRGSQLQKEFGLSDCIKVTEPDPKNLIFSAISSTPEF